MKAYRAYFFDLYGTLVDIHTDENAPGFWRRVSEVTAANGAAYAPEELREAYLREVRTREDALSKDHPAEAARRISHESFPEIRIEPVFAALYRAKGVKVLESGFETSLSSAPPARGVAGVPHPLVRETAYAFRDLSTTHLRAYAHAGELLRALRKAGREVCLLSNAQRIFTERELRALGLYDLFDDIFISSDYGCRKPDPRFFRAALESRGLRAADCLMIGNDPVCDIAGAKAVGMDALYIRSGLSPREDRKAIAADYALGEMNLARVRKMLGV